MHPQLRLTLHPREPNIRRGTKAGVKSRLEASARTRSSPEQVRRLGVATPGGWRIGCVLPKTDALSLLPVLSKASQNSLVHFPKRSSSRQRPEWKDQQ